MIFKEAANNFNKTRKRQNVSFKDSLSTLLKLSFLLLKRNLLFIIFIIINIIIIRGAFLSKHNSFASLSRSISQIVIK